ncbi:excisionase family DNA binding domain protein [Fictibacillus macauensis ZFHKF-1]|uniref:Excisionase family DNA binding domain protein n=1 Tax=Fictibacillus macauensis ZFHKF-1 TaxID=1196324 RepID=I8AGG6_9BACL|nr:excisionase family DNA-binding protein [Fictibacillus macauensis]EIT84777.1 excisionase family DNA binding domain protein [Fictibacillus macauensis ZFHKF-1]
MYLTLNETAEYLELPPAFILKLIETNKIRAFYDGQEYMINKDQFATHLEQMEKYKRLVEEYLDEPIPEDWDAKDED